MNPKNITLQNARSIVAVLAPLSLWLMLFLSLQSGEIGDIAHPGSKYILLQGLRATLPLVAAFLAVVIIVIKMPRQRLGGVLFLGPLGLVAVYGAVGVIASTLSPSGFVSLYWSVSYLSVPLVLWAIVWRPNAFDWIGRLLALNWLILILASASLFAFGLIYLSLGSFVLNPSSWLNCESQEWFDKTSHFIRDTGVGRYAALTAIIALSRLWHPRWRSLWSLIFLASIILLLYSGARTAMVGFAVAAPLIVLFSGGKRTALGIFIIGVAVLWTTGVHRDFIDNCLFRGANARSLSSASQIAPPPTISAPESPQSLNSSSQIAPPPTISAPESPQSLNSSVPSLRDTSLKDPGGMNIPAFGRIPSGFFGFSGRSRVWRRGLDLVGNSPWLGYGFHADRLMLGTHAHNSLVHSLLQTGVVGTIPFAAGMLLAWAMLIRAGLNLSRFSQDHKPVFIQVAGMLAFLSIRSITESTGAFFGVDWLLLGPILLYLQVLNSGLARTEITSQRHGSLHG